MSWLGVIAIRSAPASRNPVAAKDRRAKLNEGLEEVLRASRCLPGLVSPTYLMRRNAQESEHAAPTAIDHRPRSHTCTSYSCTIELRDFFVTGFKVYYTVDITLYSAARPVRV